MGKFLFPLLLTTILLLHMIANVAALTVGGGVGIGVGVGVGVGSGGVWIGGGGGGGAGAGSGPVSKLDRAYSALQA